MKKTLLPCLVVFCVFCLTSTVLGAQPSAPQVVVSIKPIHALVAGVMQGVGEPQLLLKGGGSPHGYVLRPSEARALSRADLIIWVGHQLETFLEKPLETLGKNARQLELSEALQSQLLPLREQGNWESHTHDEPAGHVTAEEMNPHLWLDPLLAKQLVMQVAEVLAEIDPLHQQQYRQNAGQLLTRLDLLHRQLQVKLAPVKAIPYVVFHDAYQYFESAYGLNAVGSIAVDPERQPGARRILQMREKITRLQARCVFSEPQFEPRLLATLIEGTEARTGILDPLGAELPAGPETYFLLLNRLADDLLRGLQ
ncbi:MAG TPA: zinc ABC transporter substrate-binding protein [Malonomonas sp.]